MSLTGKPTKRGGWNAYFTTYITPCSIENHELKLSPPPHAGHGGWSKWRDAQYPSGDPRVKECRVVEMRNIVHGDPLSDKLFYVCPQLGSQYIRHNNPEVQLPNPIGKCMYWNNHTYKGLIDNPFPNVFVNGSGEESGSGAGKKIITAVEILLIVFLVVLLFFPHLLLHSVDVSQLE